MLARETNIVQTYIIYMASAREEVLYDVNLIALIFRNLSVGALGASARACSAWREASGSNELWLPLVQSKYPGAHELVGVASFKAVYAKMDGGVELKEEPTTTISDYQFIVSLRYSGTTVLAKGCQGADPDEISDVCDQPEGEEFGFRAVWYADMPDTEWLWEALSNETIEGTAEALQLQLNDDPSNNVGIYGEAIDTLTENMRKSELQSKVLANVRVFRKADQCIARLLDANLLYDTQDHDDVWKFESESTRTPFDDSGTSSVYFVVTFGPVFDEHTSRMRWALQLSLEHKSYPNLPEDQEDYEDFDFEEDEQIDGMPESSFLCAIERLIWV